MKNQSTILISVLVLVLVSFACCLVLCVVLFAGGSILFSNPFPTATSVVISDPPVEVLLDPTATKPSTVVSPINTEESLPTPDEVSHIETLLTLEQEFVPINDAVELADRLTGKKDIPETLIDPNAPYQVGDQKSFWVTNVDTNNNFQISATLRYLGENVYIWIEDDVSYSTTDLNMLGYTFDKHIYPTNQAFFGEEWRPGVDGDPHIYIVYAGGLGYPLAGYFSSVDSLHPDAHAYSNAHEMFLINSDDVSLGEDFIYSTLAHEFQHMIHWYRDKNEETWLNEGFSMLAELINQFDSSEFDYFYIINPDLQLTDWSGVVGNNRPHYGAANLFTTYFLDRFGEEATQALVGHEVNGMESIDLVLEDLDIRDPLTNEIITADDVFRDWAVTNYLLDDTVADGRYDYEIYPYAPKAKPGTILSTCPTGSTSYDVYQFGVDYIKITCPGDYTLTFEGDPTVKILPANPYSGSYFFWSNTGDHSNMSLTKTFDFSTIDAPVEMTYQTWYDLEEDYDYVFISASLDGTDWQILNTTSCTTDNPSGNSYGCGLNGQSTGWQLEQVDLSSFAGKEVTLRFDYVTDAAVNGKGLVIDDIAIDAIDYFTDFEVDDGGWNGEGFVRIQNALPQEFIVTMLTLGDETTVTPLLLDENNQIKVEVSINEDIESVILVISGGTPVTRLKGKYQIGID
jgi:hypothetical protein